MKTCPICIGRYGAIRNSEDVCERHQDWFVIICGICGKTRFSDNASICIDCAGSCERPVNGYCHDHRFYLKMIGQEGSPTSGL